MKAEGVRDIKVTQAMGSESSAVELKGALFPSGQFKSNADAVTVNNTASYVGFYSLTQAGFDSVDTPEIKEGLEVFREYVNKDGKVVDSIAIGEEVTVRLKTRSIDQKGYWNVAVVDLLPGGFQVVIDSIDRSGWDYVDAREDRVLYFTKFTPEVNSFEYKIKAINKGEYMVPPVFAESMYDQSKQAKGKPGKFKVQ